MFKPTNRNVLVTLPKKKEDGDSGVLLPDGFQKKAEFQVAEVVSYASDCKVVWRKGNYIVFPSNMLQQFSVQDSQISIISENYILGYVN